MVFFKNKDDNPEKWRDKYLNLLNSQEQAEKTYKANEELLCKTIIRFALAIKGLSRELDPHLERIRNLLKSGLENRQLQIELEAFSNALMLLDDNPGPSQFETFLLFEFLFKQYPQHKLELENLQKKNTEGAFKNTQSLIIALLELVDEKSAGKVYFGVELPDTVHNEIRMHLLRLLDSTGIPEQFSEQLEQIKKRIQTDTTIKSLTPVFDDAVTFLLAVKKHLVSEQCEMATFLSKLTEQLADMAVKVTGVDHASENAVINRKYFEESVSQQVQDLQIQSDSATQLDTLKQLVHGHLSSINEQLQAHNRQEQLEREYIQGDLRFLTQKIRDMEMESTELKLKLDIAQQHAIRDPLTDLPNRLAFDNRLKDEIARWQRNAQALSMLVWDIDFFKLINDNYGHKTGDKALVAIARLLEEHSRKTDFVARFGGEEFVMLFPETDAQTAFRVANKLRETIENACFRASGDKISITLSCGISQYLANDTPETFFERADKALYQAKENGRNQCVII
ncbi:MAG: GGDEF domain-containing protein [Methylomonas sp.]|jgi:diguanylate cyclase